MSSESGGPGEIRSAADGLRRVRGDLPGEADEVDQGIRASIDEVSALVDEAAVGELAPELRRVAHEIRVLGTQMTAATEDGFASVDAALASEAGALEALLRPSDAGAVGDIAGVAGGAVSSSGEPAVLVGWPLYVSDDLASRAADAATVHGWKPEGKAVNRPVNQVVAQLPPKSQAVGGELLRDRSSHAISRHGHHLTVEHELARIQWLHDPAYQDRWVLNPDGTVTSSRKRDGSPHKVGTETGHYTSAEAAAKPLAAFLAAAGRTRAQVDAYLDSLRTDDDDPWLSVFLHPDVTGITAEDVYTLHAPGTSTPSGRELWKETRWSALNGLGEVPAVREIDAVTGGARPGSVILFVKSDPGRWRLVTSYFTGCPESSDTPYTEL